MKTALTQSDLLQLPVKEAFQRFAAFRRGRPQCHLDLSADAQEISDFLTCLGVALHADQGQLSQKACQQRLSAIKCDGFFQPCGPQASNTPHSLTFRGDAILYDNDNQPLQLSEGQTLHCLVVYCDSRYLDIQYAGRCFSHVPRNLLSHLDCPQCQLS